MRSIAWPGITVDVPDAWDDITELVEADDPPWSLADPCDGVGALQFSIGLFREGSDPEVGSDDLAEMLEEFAANRGFEGEFDRVELSGDLSHAAASFADSDDFIRVWYLSDGRNVVLATYVCSWDDRDCEAEERDAVIRSIRFDP